MPVLIYQRIKGEVGLTYIYGIGRSTAQYILTKAGMTLTKSNQWNDDEQTAIRNIINNEFKTEGALRSEVQMNIKRPLISRPLPWPGVTVYLLVRGQRTRTNSRTRKGKQRRLPVRKKLRERTSQMPGFMTRYLCV